MTPKLVLVIATIISLLILENKFPFFPIQNSLRSRITNNFELGAVNSIVSGAVTIFFTQYLMINPIDRGIISMIPSPVVGGVLSFLILDLYIYFWHRAMHLVPLAWRFHRLHHTDRSMNVSTAYRFHAIEIISSSIPKLVIIWLLGIASDVVLFYELVFTFIVALHHSNLSIPGAVDRLLATIIVTPNYHRIHHSQVITETNSNYGSVFTWWDRIFRTQNTGVNASEIQLGISNQIGDLNLWQSLLLPFKTID